MKKPDKSWLSRYRQEVHRKNEELKRLFLKAAFDDPLLAGTPGKTLKTCGKENCKCRNGGDDRHGPYLAVQIRKDGKQRNMTLKASEARFFEMAQHYQYQRNNRRKILALHSELLEEYDKIIEARTIWDKKEE